MALFANIEAFIELLGEHHRFLRTEIELANAFLLHRRCRKGRLRLAFPFPLFHFRNHIRFVVRLALLFPHEVMSNSLRFVASRNSCLFPVDFYELCRKRNAVIGLVRAADRPILFRHKGFDFLFPFANKTDCYRLDTTGTESFAHLFPQERAQFIAHNAV